MAGSSRGIDSVKQRPAVASGIDTARPVSQGPEARDGWLPGGGQWWVQLGDDWSARAIDCHVFAQLSHRGCPGLVSDNGQGRAGRPNCSSCTTWAKGVRCRQPCRSRSGVSASMVTGPRHSQATGRIWTGMASSSRRNCSR